MEISKRDFIFEIKRPKKDKKLSVVLSREYYTQYKPKKWLFKGEKH